MSSLVHTLVSDTEKKERMHSELSKYADEKNRQGSEMQSIQSLFLFSMSGCCLLFLTATRKQYLFVGGGGGGRYILPTKITVTDTRQC